MVWRDCRGTLSKRHYVSYTLYTIHHTPYTVPFGGFERWVNNEKNKTYQWNRFETFHPSCPKVPFYCTEKHIWNLYMRQHLLPPRVFRIESRSCILSKGKTRHVFYRIPTPFKFELRAFLNGLKSAQYKPSSNLKHSCPKVTAKLQLKTPFPGCKVSRVISVWHSEHDCDPFRKAKVPLMCCHRPGS